MQGLASDAAAGLASHQRHAVLDDFLTRAHVGGVDTTSLRAEAQALKTAAKGDWIVGKTGGGRTAKATDQQVTGQYRDDEIFWLRDECVARYGLRALPALWRAVDQLVIEANAALPDHLRWELGGRTTPMVACYHPGSAGYSYHVDNPDNDGRVVTAIFYLNKGWRSTDGGCVRLHPSLLPPDSAAAAAVAAPPPAAAAPPPAASTTVSIETMTVAEVSATVAEGLRDKLDAGIILRLVQKIKVEEIDGEVLASLSEGDMEEVLGLTTFGKRRKLSQLIAKLHEGVATPAPATTPDPTHPQTKEVVPPEPLDVRPIDGRLLLFWSNKRTPHEVLPLSPTATLKDGRIAVTCWYYDAAERAGALAAAGATAETLLASKPKPTSKQPAAVPLAEPEPDEDESSRAARNKKKNRKKKDQQKKKNAASSATTAGTQEPPAPAPTAQAWAPAPASPARGGANGKVEWFDITTDLLVERIAALVGSEGAAAFKEMKAADFYTKLAADPALGGPGADLSQHRRAIAVQVIKAKQALAPPTTPPSSASQSEEEEEEDPSESEEDEAGITMMHGVPIAQVKLGPSKENDTGESGATRSSTAGGAAAGAAIDSLLKSAGVRGGAAATGAEYEQAVASRKQAWAVAKDQPPKTKTTQGLQANRKKEKQKKKQPGGEKPVVGLSMAERVAAVEVLQMMNFVF